MNTLSTLCLTLTLASVGAYAAEITETPHTQQLAQQLTAEKRVLVDCYIKEGQVECAIHYKDGITYIHPDY